MRAYNAEHPKSNDHIAKLGKVPSSEYFKGVGTITSTLTFLVIFFCFFWVKSVIVGIVKKIDNVNKDLDIWEHKLQM